MANCSPSMFTTVIEPRTGDHLTHTGTFISEYAATLLASGATCIRLEKNVNRIAAHYEVCVSMTIMPRHIHLTVHDHGEGRTFTSIVSIPVRPISYTLNSDLSQLSWDIADKHYSLHRARRRMDAMLRRDCQNPAIPLILVPLANASFCHLFGGDWIAMLVVAVATLAGYFLKQRMLACHYDVRTMMVVCAFVSAVLGATDGLFHLGTTPMLAVGSSVLYLVPGIPFLNSLSDMIYRHYICAISRFFDAVVLTACLSIGLCAAMLLMNIGMF